MRNSDGVFTACGTVRLLVSGSRCRRCSMIPIIVLPGRNNAALPLCAADPRRSLRRAPRTHPAQPLSVHMALRTWVGFGVLCVFSSLLFSPRVSAAIVNRTIDDSNADLLYLPDRAWSANSACPSCALGSSGYIDTSLAATWHDGTANETFTTPLNMSFSFTGACHFVCHCLCVAHSNDICRNSNIPVLHRWQYPTERQHNGELYLHAGRSTPASLRSHTR
jgi:hypothetical protein